MFSREYDINFAPLVQSFLGEWTHHPLNLHFNIISDLDIVDESAMQQQASRDNLFVHAVLLTS